MVFYQAALLAGYAYAHATTRWLGPRRQAGLHSLVLLLPFVVLPIALPAGWTPPGETNPIPWLLALLPSPSGSPSSRSPRPAPCSRRWFAATGHPAARRPVLPLRGEQPRQHARAPRLSDRRRAVPRLHAQSQPLGVGYGVLVVLVAACAVAPLAGSAGHVGGPASAARRGARRPPRRRIAADRPITRARRARWVAPGLRAVEPDAGRHDLPDHRHRGDPAPLGHPAGDLPADVHPRLRPAAAHPAPRLGRASCRWRSLPLVLVLVGPGQRAARARASRRTSWSSSWPRWSATASWPATGPPRATSPGSTSGMSLGGVLGGAFNALRRPDRVRRACSSTRSSWRCLPLLPARPPAAWLRPHEPGPGSRAPARRSASCRSGSSLGRRARGLRARGRSAPPWGWLPPPLLHLLAAPGPLRAGARRRAPRRRRLSRRGRALLLHAERNFFGVSRVTRRPGGHTTC